MNDINDKFSQRDEIALLYLQSLEILTLYEQPIPKDTFNPCKYYLLPKKWLDDYKIKNNYNIIKKQIGDILDYNEYKSQLINNSYSINDKFENSLYSQREGIPQIEKNVKIIGENIEYPIDFFPVKEEVLKNILNNNNDFLYELIIGENNIFIIDNKSKKNIFICSIKSEKEDDDDNNDNFIVNVDFIIEYNEEKRFQKEMEKYIIDKKGFQQYCQIRKLKPKKNEMQDILDLEGDKIGILYTINENIYEVPDNNINNNNNLNQNLNLINDNTLETKIDFKKINLFSENSINKSNVNLNNPNNIMNYQNNNNAQNFNGPNIHNNGKYILHIDGDIYYKLKKTISISIMDTNNINNNNIRYNPNNNNNMPRYNFNGNNNNFIRYNRNNNNYNPNNNFYFNNNNQ